MWEFTEQLQKSSPIESKETVLLCMFILKISLPFLNVFSFWILFFHLHISNSIQDPSWSITFFKRPFLIPELSIISHLLHTYNFLATSFMTPLSYENICILTLTWSYLKTVILSLHLIHLFISYKLNCVFHLILFNTYLLSKWMECNVDSCY